MEDGRFFAVESIRKPYHKSNEKREKLYDSKKQDGKCAVLFLLFLCQFLRSYTQNDGLADKSDIVHAVVVDPFIYDCNHAVEIKL